MFSRYIFLSVICNKQLILLPKTLNNIANKTSLMSSIVWAWLDNRLRTRRSDPSWKHTNSASDLTRGSYSRM